MQFHAFITANNITVLLEWGNDAKMNISPHNLIN